MLLVLKLVTEVAVDRPEGVRLLFLAVAPVGERLMRAVLSMVGEGLNWTSCWEQCELAEEVDVWCFVCQHTAVKGGQLHSIEPTNCVMTRGTWTPKGTQGSVDHEQSKDTLAGR
jgi:hypothetical protein